MLFHSGNFLFIFLPLALAGYVLAKQAGMLWGKLWLIGVSMVFYASWRWEYLPLMVGSIVFNYGVATALQRIKIPSQRFALLWAGIGVNLFLLGYFKYKNFFLENLRAVTGTTIDLPDVALPLAISFYTFTQIAYITDIYRRAENHRNVLDYCMFIMFFPHLIAGPILRHWEFFPQFRQRLPHILTRHLFPGIVLLILGLRKKVIFAESAAQIADPIFMAPAGAISFFEAWVGTFAFAMQVYYDFSAYSDIALGLGLLFGFRLPVNFLSPYKTTSVIDFWACWHITLGRFLRDYIYAPLSRLMRDHIKLPLQKSNQTLIRAILGVMATMIVSGIWHGAGWTFVIFGISHGLALAVNYTTRKMFGPPRTRSFAIIMGKWMLTYFFIYLSFVYFRSPNLDKANSMIFAMLGGNGLSLPSYHHGSYGAWLENAGVSFLSTTLPETGRVEVLWLFFLLAWALALPNTFEFLRRWRPATDRIDGSSRWVFRPTWWLAIGLGVIFFWVVKSFFIAKPSEFIYFQF